MFQIGHLNILKKQCEYLVEGVSTDELVKQYRKKRLWDTNRAKNVETIRYV